MSTSKLHFGRVKMATAVRREWYADIPAGTDPAAVMEPSYWAHHARDVSPNDILECMSEDGSWEGRYRVLHVVNNLEIRLSPIYVVHHDAGEAVDSDVYEIKWKGPHGKFCVVRKGDGMELATGLYPKTAALERLQQLEVRH